MDSFLARGLNAALLESRAALLTRGIWDALRLRMLWRGLAMFGLGFMILWYGWLEPSWLSYSLMPLPAKQATYFDGDAAVITVGRCNAKPIERQYMLSHVLTRLDPPTEACPRRTILQPGIVQIDSGCHVADSAANVIPAGTCEGRYIVEGHAETQGTLRTAIVEWQSSVFRIVHRPPAEAAASSPP